MSHFKTVSKKGAGHRSLLNVTICTRLLLTVTKRSSEAAKTAKKTEWNIKGWQTRGLIRGIFPSLYNDLRGSHFCEK